MTGELPPTAWPEDEPSHTHHYEYRWDIKDWWCLDCMNVTDFCVELNDFGQGDERED